VLFLSFFVCFLSCFLACFVAVVAPWLTIDQYHALWMGHVALANHSSSGAPLTF